MKKITFETYKKAVLEKYSKERSGELSRFFNQPTPGKIKRASKQKVTDKEQNPNDIKILSNFFEVSKATDFSIFLAKVEAERFKSVPIFLKGETKNPEEELIEYVAWLVDFKPRPYSRFIENKGKTIDVTQKSSSQTNSEQQQNRHNPHDIREPDEGNGRWKKIVVTISFISSLAVLYFVIDWKQKECMTWLEDHYELAICPKNFNPKYIPIDNKRLKEFKKIKVDTNYTFFNDKGKAIVWYDKTGGKIEFFNKNGIHPINGDSLKPVTQGIVRKYVFGEE